MQDYGCVNNLCQLTEEQYNQLLLLLNNQTQVVSQQIDWVTSFKYFSVGFTIYTSCFITGKFLAMIYHFIKQI